MMASTDCSGDESFIILGTSPGTSLDAKCNGLGNTDSLTKVQIEEAIKELPAEANMAFKAQFNLGECPSAASMMVASSIVTDDRCTEQLQKSFGALLDENVLLKETLKQNNESMKQQFLLIASCQEDMMQTHTIHKEKFDETRMLVERLRMENKKLKQDIVRLTDMESNSLQPKSVESSKSTKLSAVEFVTSPDDDVINKLTAQLELVESQRRQVILENEKLTWQKESLENILDATSKERDDLKEKIRKMELQLGSLDNESAVEISKLKTQVEELQQNLQMAYSMSVSSEEITKRDNVITQLENKVLTLQNDLKTSQLKILELESIKLEFSKHKSGVSETVKMYKEQIQDINCRLREAQTTVFQPVRFSVSPEKDSSNEYMKLSTNLKIYEKTLKHLSDMLNALVNGTSDCLLQLLGSVASLHEYKLDRSTADTFKLQLAELKNVLEKQHASALSNIANVRGTMTVLNDMFKDYNEVLEKAKQQVPPPANVAALTAALVARGDEIQQYEETVRNLRAHRDDVDVMKAQLELYKSDFEAERESREKMASEKETILADMRVMQRRNQELVLQLEEVRKQNPDVYKAATSKKIEVPNTGNSSSDQGNNATGNMVYKCPKCFRFSSNSYQVMEDHFDDCLDDF